MVNDSIREEILRMAFGNEKYVAQKAVVAVLNNLLLEGKIDRDTALGSIDVAASCLYMKPKSDPRNSWVKHGKEQLLKANSSLIAVVTGQRDSEVEDGWI